MQKSEQRARNRAYCVCLFVRYCSMNILYIHEYTSEESLGPKSGVEDSAQSGNNCSEPPVVFVHVIGTW